MFVPVPCLALAQSSDQTKSKMTQSGDQAGQGASAGKGGNGSDANGAATPGGGASDANATAAPSSKPPVRRSEDGERFHEYFRKPGLIDAESR